MALMTQILDQKTTKFAFSPQFANRIDGIADSALAGWLNGVSGVSGQTKLPRTTKSGPVEGQKESKER